MQRQLDHRAAPLPRKRRFTATAQPAADYLLRALLVACRIGARPEGRQPRAVRAGLP